MKLKLFHKLFLLIAVTALVASLAMALVMAWNLSRGFSGYLESRDIETLEEHTELISRELEGRGGVKALESGDFSLEELYGDMMRDGLIPRTRSRFDKRPLPSGTVGPPPNLDRGGGFSKPPPPPGDRRAPDFLAPRLLVFDTNGDQVFGPPPPPKGGPEMIERAILSDGQIVATAKMLPPGPTPRAVDAGFLRNQFVSAALLLVGSTIFAALAAWWFARIGAKRLGEMEAVTKEIANGNFEIRADTSGHDEVSMMGQDINQMAQSLARADQARRGWLAEIGHELRTPLTVLSGELDALKDGIRPLNQAAISSLKEETDRLGNLIEDLHFMAVSDLTDAPSSFSAYDAVSLVHNVAQRFQPMLAEAGIDLAINTGNETSLPVIWDGKRIEQLLGNLLTNAMRYTDAPGNVRINMKAMNGFVTFGIEDSPPTVPEKALPQLFEPLFRVDEARDRTSGGSGLGLAVCKAIAVAHGGTINAKQSELGGLLVEVKLPIEAKWV